MLEQLSVHDGPRRAEAEQMLRLIARTARQGPPANLQLCRPLGDEHHTLIFSHVYTKQGQKLGHGQRKRATENREAYFRAKRAGELEVVD